jgi:hypothetical protein
MTHNKACTGAGAAEFSPSPGAARRPGDAWRHVLVRSCEVWGILIEASHFEVTEWALKFMASHCKSAFG